MSGELVFLLRILAGGNVSLPAPRVLPFPLPCVLPFPFAVPTREVDGAVRLGGDRDLVSDRESDRESLLSRAAFVRARGGGDRDRDRESYELLGLLARLLGGEREPSLPAFSLRFGGDAERVYERPRASFLLGGDRERDLETGRRPFPVAARLAGGGDGDIDDEYRRFRVAAGGGDRDLESSL